MLEIKKLFPKYRDPFLFGGLGNRENDAIAYRAAGIPLQNIFIID
jgi:phosphatidate phosphatase PAH1